MTIYKCVRCGSEWDELAGPAFEGEYVCIGCKFKELTGKDIFMKKKK